MSRSRIVVKFLLGGALLAGAPRPAHADGGTVRASVAEGGLRVTVFTSPTPPRAGSLDVSVLVQDAATGQPVPGAHVHIRAGSRNDPGLVVARIATADEATNKLFVAAVLDLPAAGWWEFRVRVEGHGGPVEVAFDLELAEPRPEWVSFLGWIAWPVVVVLLFAVHRLLVRQKGARAGPS